MTKLLILDKDGTLTRPKSGERFVQSPEDQELIPGVAEALARYRAAGWVMAIASNQGGVEAGFKTLESVAAEMRYGMDLTGIDTALFCPFMGWAESCWQVPSTDTPLIEWRDQVLIERPNHGACSGPTPRSMGCRKPQGGMLRIAQTIYNELDNVLMVGDRPEDQGAAEAAGVAFVWAHDWIYMKMWSGVGLY